jgi:hypothetical protein
MDNRDEWIARCSARLHAQWPRLPKADRDDAARDLWEEERWRMQEPEMAAAEWVRQGIPGAI